MRVFPDQERSRQRGRLAAGGAASKKASTSGAQIRAPKTPKP